MASPRRSPVIALLQFPYCRVMSFFLSSFGLNSFAAQVEGTFWFSPPAGARAALTAGAGDGAIETDEMRAAPRAAEGPREQGSYVVRERASVGLIGVGPQTEPRRPFAYVPQPSGNWPHSWATTGRRGCGGCGGGPWRKRKASVMNDGGQPSPAMEKPVLGRKGGPARG